MARQNTLAFREMKVMFEHCVAVSKTESSSTGSPRVLTANLGSRHGCFSQIVDEKLRLREVKKPVLVSESSFGFRCETRPRTFHDDSGIRLSVLQV